MASRAEADSSSGGLEYLANGNSNSCINSASRFSNRIRSMVGSRVRAFTSSHHNSLSPKASRKSMNYQAKKSLDPNQPFSADQVLRLWPEGEVPWLLSDYHRSIIIKTWKDDFDTLYKLGSEIYKEVFQNSPDAKMLFPQVAAAGANWKETGKFRSQALKFVQVLSHIVKNVYHPEHMDSLLYTVGKAHRKFASRGFEPKHWTVFQKSIETAMAKQMNEMPELTDQEKQDATEAWKFVSIYLIRKMKRGFVEDV